MGFFANTGCIINDEVEIEANRFFRYGRVLAEHMGKTIDRYDDHPNTYYTGDIFRSLGNFGKVNRGEHGRGADEFYNLAEYERRNCYKPNGNACFLKRNNFIFKHDSSMDYIECMKSYEKRTNVTTKCRFPEFCER